MNIIFMGTPEFALPGLKALVNSSHKVIAVITQPDKKKGRGLKLSQSAVKAEALRCNLPVFDFKKVSIDKGLDLLNKLTPDIIVVIAFGQILSSEVLTIPKYGCINVHASLLPKYRGAAPINRSIINNDHSTGITIMQMDAGLDTGDILLQKEVKIEEDDDICSLKRKLSLTGATLLTEAIGRIEANTITHIKQDDSLSSYAPKISREDGLIDWCNSAVKVNCLVRGLFPKPNAYTHLNGKTLKIIKCTVEQYSNKTGKAGEIMGIEKNKGIYVCTGKGIILIKEVQPENGKIMKSFDFAMGRRLKSGDFFL